MTEAIEWIGRDAYRCTCQREKCRHVWVSSIKPKKCPKCQYLHWKYKWGGPFLNGDKEDGRKTGKRWPKKKKGGEPGGALLCPTT